MPTPMEQGVELTLRWFQEELTGRRLSNQCGRTN